MEETKKKRKKTFLIILLIVLLGGLSTISVLYFLDYKKGYTGKIEKGKRIVSSDENGAIFELYTNAVEYALKNYIDKHNGAIPTFDEIKDSIVFEKHKVVCEKSKINKNGKLYLENCSIDGDPETGFSYGEDEDAIPQKENKIYFCKGIGDYYFTNKIYDNNVQIINTYECDNSDCQGYAYNKLSNEAIIYDGKYYIYSINSSTKKNINLGNEKYQAINYIYDSTKTYGLVLNTYRHVGNDSTFIANFYNFNTQQNTNTTNEYQSMYSVDSLLAKGYIFANRKRGNGNYYYTDIVNFNTGEVIKTFSDVSSFKDNRIGYSAYVSGSDAKINIYDKDFNIIMEVKDREYGINSDDTITIVKDNHFEIMSLNNELLYTSKDYKQIVTIVEDYITIIDEDKNLKIIDLNENEKATLVKLTDNLNVHPYISGWYSENGKNGIYIVVENKDIPYGTEGSGLEYYYIPTTGETGVIKTVGVGGYAKPVLYLYPKKKTNIKITFEKPNLLTTTYPKYKNVWEVTAKPNGDLYDKNGKYYYGLYWEEEGSIDVDFHEGFYVTKDNAIGFLEEKLSYLGLNNRERNEFIMYWLPILEKNEQNLVYFETTSERESYNKLIINPKPDSILRLAIHVKKVNEPITIQEQKLQKFRRKGFTAVEWGGVIH